MEEFSLEDLEIDLTEELTPLPTSNRYTFEWEKNYGGMTKEAGIAFYQKEIDKLNGVLIEPEEQVLVPEKSRSKRQCHTCRAYVSQRSDYCSNACRQAAYRKRDKLYNSPNRNSEVKFVSTEDGLLRLLVEQPCYYCGLVADTVDHSIPQNLLQRFTDDELRCMSGIRNRLVMACRECNSILGGRVFWTLEERRNEVKKSLRRRYKKYIDYQYWTDEDIKREEIEGNMLIAVKRANAMNEVIMARLRWPKR